MKSYRFASACLVVTAAVFISVGFTQPQTVPHELAQRFVGVGTNIFVGKLPPKARVGFDFPLPQNTRVVGASAVPVTDPWYNYVSLYFSSQRPVSDVKTFYRQAFRSRGWRVGQTYPQTGFLPAGTAEIADSLVFCYNQGDKGTEVYLTLSSQRQTTLIDAQVSTYNRSQGIGACDENSNREPPIPLLEAPEASQSSAVENLSGFGQGNGGSVIVLKTALSADELLEHYARQLEGSGWQAQATAKSGGVQFRTYRFRDGGDAFLGTLQIVPLARGRYSAQVTVVNL